MQDILFEVIVEGTLTDLKFRMILKDRIGRLSFPQKRRDGIGDLCRLLSRQVGTHPAVFERFFVEQLRLFRIVRILAESAVNELAAAVAGAG